jgi:hypothetical protein
MAQIEVLQNTNRDFSVNVTNGITDPVTYTWNASGAGITNSAAVNATTTNLVNVTFGAAPSTGTLTVYGTANSCSGDNRTATLNVVTTLTYGASFASASQSVCPQTTTNPTGGDAAAVTINFTGGNVTAFTYSIDGVPAAAPVTFTAATSYSLNVATAFTNAQAGAHTIEITSITGESGPTSLYSAGTEPTHTINVTTAPEISNIF